jgi:argininosuccinate lyase
VGPHLTESGFAFELAKVIDVSKMSVPCPVSVPVGRVLTGRIDQEPSALLHEEILAPQFSYEAVSLLPCYVRTEKALLAEYLRLGLMTGPQARQISAILDSIDSSALAADPVANMSDIAFAIEVHVLDRLDEPVPCWHVDRSRNDLQACAQLLYARGRMRQAAGQLLACFESARRLAAAHLTTLMPGYTHLQSAQVMTPGFYLAGLTYQLTHTVRRWLAIYDSHDLCPLGAGAMTGQELAWDRLRLAALLGFRAPHPHPLSAVAARCWVLEIAAECSTLGVALSRFVTDLMSWGGSAYGFVDLPDSLSGISSAMPQKKNFPVLERIRGRTAHLTAGYLDAATAQRATSFANSVEVGKEGAAFLPGMFDALGSVLRLLGSVLDHIEFRADRMLEVVEREYLGGLSLANSLTLRCAIPWRDAQVVAGDYIVAATARGLTPQHRDPALLEEVARERGHEVREAADLLAQAFDPGHGIYGKQPAGSAHPTAVADLLDQQTEQTAALAVCWQLRGEWDADGASRLKQVLTGEAVNGA